MWSSAAATVELALICISRRARRSRCQGRGPRLEQPARSATAGKSHKTIVPALRSGAGASALMDDLLNVARVEALLLGEEAGVHVAGAAVATDHERSRHRLDRI